MSRGLSVLDAIELVLREAGRPLAPKELLREIHQRQLLDLTTRTPVKSLHARLSVDILRRGFRSRFKRVAPGEFALRDFPGDEYPAPRHVKKLPRSRVMVFPSPRLAEIGHFHGIRRDHETYFGALVNPSTAVPLSRHRAELDSDYKQIVSYVLIRHQDSLLRFTRGTVSTIGDYFYGQYSLGFGGHVENTDWNTNLVLLPEADTNVAPFGANDYGYSNAVRRELHEEIGIDPGDVSPHNFRTIGVLNDDSTELGRRHFAFVHLLELPEPTFARKEIAVRDLRLVPIASLSQDFAGYEYWSKLCIQTFFGERLALGCYVHPRRGFSLGNHSDLVLITGYIGSGKSEACALLQRSFGFIQVPCSRILQQLIGCPPIEDIGRASMQQLGYRFINTPDGHERFAHGILDFMAKAPGKRYVFDGLRYPKTLEVLQDLIGSPITVMYIESTIDSQYKYYRMKSTEAPSFNEFLSLVNHPVERQIETFYPIADIIVYNHGPRESLVQELDRFLIREAILT